MKYAQLHFLGMTKYVIIEDYQTHYAIDLPTQKIYPNFIWKEMTQSPEIVEKIRLVFTILPNKYYETDKDNAPECFAEFSHVEIIK